MNVTYFDIIIISIILLSVLYLYGKYKYSYFKDKEVKYVEPALPFLGTITSLFFQRENIMEFLENVYKQFPDQKYVGLFEIQKPLIYLRDLELIRQIAVKDFDNFVNHRSLFISDHDTIFGNSLVFLEGEKWRDMRATLSPAFTGSKMRKMFEFVEECAEGVADYYIAQINKTGSDMIEIDVKSELSKFTNDVIATAAYGIKVNSFQNKDNEFYRLGKIAVEFKAAQVLKFMAFTIVSESIIKKLNISYFNAEVSKFFKEVVLNTMKYRDQNCIIRNDMIHLLMEAKKGALTHDNETGESYEAGYATVQESPLGKRIVTKKWSDDEIVAQAFVFFISGFETVSTFLTFFFYEMVLNPEIQKKLQDEIDNFNLFSDGKFVYTDLQKLKYLDMCISETLRMWPPALTTDRVCTKTYTLPPSSNLSKMGYKVNVGESVWIPIYAIHHDPKYFPNPKQFDPERFSDERKSSLNTMAFMPFGIGPRNCIGSRFALMEVKIIIYHMLSKFNIVTTEKTKIPVILKKLSFCPKVKGGMYLGLKPRIVKKSFNITI